MKILYATSIVFPTKLANRIQVLNNAYEFEKILGQDFILGCHDVRVDQNFKNKRIHNFYGSCFSPLLGLWYTYYIWKNKITHLYVREEMLFIFIFIYSQFLFTRKPKFIYEAHWRYTRSNSLINYIFTKVLLRADMVVSISKKLIEDLVSEGMKREKIIFCPDGVNLDDYEKELDIQKFKRENEIPQDKEIIIYAGSYKTLNVKKGSDELIKVFSKLSKINNDLFLLFVGVGEIGKDELSTDLTNLNVSQNNFKIITRVPHKEVANFLKISDLQIMNFPWSEHYAYYMSPMKLFEYMASDKPLISTDLPSVRDVLDESLVIFVKPGDEKDLEDKISEFFKDKSIGIIKAKKARQEILKYTWEQRVKNILEKIKTIK